MRRVAALVVVVAALVAAGLLATGDRALRLDYALQAAALRHAAVATLRVGPDGEGIPMFLNPSDRVITPQVRAGLFEVVETAYLPRILRPGDTFVDVGANVGYYTLLAAKLVGEGGRVFAFEPDPESFALLERNVRLNGFDNVVLERKAASNEAGTLRLYLAPENKGDHQIYPSRGEEREFVEVEAVTLDAYFADVPGRVDFVKIDTQGAEMAILEGMAGLLESDAIVLSVEFWPYGLREFGSDAPALLDFLLDRDFRLFDYRSTEVGPEWLLHRYPVDEEVFTNLLAVKGRAEVERLRERARRLRDELERLDSEAARAELARIRAAHEALGPRSSSFPHRPAPER